MAGFDLANLDRSALQQRIALHEQHEDSLGSLPDLIDASNSSYPATTSGANTTSEGESSRDEIGRRDRGKENQSPTVGNVSEKSLGGKTEVSLRVIVWALGLEFYRLTELLDLAELCHTDAPEDSPRDQPARTDLHPTLSSILHHPPQ